MKAVSSIFSSSTIPVLKSPPKAACHGTHSQTSYAPWASDWLECHGLYQCDKECTKSPTKLRFSAEMSSFGQFGSCPNQMSYLIWIYKRCSQVGEELPFPLLQQVLDTFSIGWEGRNNTGGWRELFYRYKLLKSLQKDLNCKFIKIMGNKTTVLLTKHYKLELSQVRTLPVWVLLRLLGTQFLIRINTNGITSTLLLWRHQGCWFLQWEQQLNFPGKSREHPHMGEEQIGMLCFFNYFHSKLFVGEINLTESEWQNCYTGTLFLIVEIVFLNTSSGFSLNITF